MLDYVKYLPTIWTLRISTLYAIWAEATTAQNKRTKK